MQFQTANSHLFQKAKLQTGVFSLKKDLSDLAPKEEASPAKQVTSATSAIKEEDESKSKEGEKEEKESVYEKWKKKNGGVATASVAKSSKESDSEEEVKKKSDEATKSSSVSPSKKEQARRNNDPKTILRGVIFALSGFQNPLRTEIRDKGMKMGAKYRPDWTDDCTHLV